VAALGQRGLDRAYGATAFSRTLVATPGRTTGRPTVASGARLVGSAMGPTTDFGNRAAPRSRLRWAASSIGYIYVFLRDKLDAGERRRRLVAERQGAEALLSGALNELATIVLREGVQHADLTGLLEAIGRAHARRESAAADMAASATLQQAEATRLGAQEAAAEAEWTASDRASRDADEILRATAADRNTAGARLTRLKDERARIARERANPAGSEARAAQLAHEALGLSDEQRALEEQIERLDRQLADLRDSSAAARATAATAKAKLEQAVASRREAASAMAASIAGHQRDRADAEREAAELTDQLGRAANELRPPHGVLLSAYQNIDRLDDTIADRSAQIAAIEQSQAHYDQRKLLTGVGLLTSMLIATAAALWAALR
jgi:chromosome segregation ATPase